MLAKEVLFSIFQDLRHSSANTNLMNSKFVNNDDMQVWLSTTLIQALGQLVDLITFYFSSLSFLMSEMLDLLKVCLIHENETLSRIGATCMEKFLRTNAEKMDGLCWDNLTDMFESLFKETSPNFLFFKYAGAGTIYSYR